MIPPTLPGDLPGLLRWCSPVRDAEDPHRLGVVVGTWPSGKVRVYWAWSESTEDIDRSRLLLDLTDATTRAHVAWWLAERCGRERHHGAPSFDAWPGVYSLSWQDTGLDARFEIAVWWHDDGCEDFQQSLIVPALEDLDPDDDTMLPDGTFWQDAEALRIVALHVAGRAA